MWDAIRAEWARRPWWMNVMLMLCVYMASSAYRSIAFTPIERDEEVWFGIVLRGVGAKVTEPLHWAVYAAGRGDSGRCADGCGRGPPFTSRRSRSAP